MIRHARVGMDVEVRDQADTYMIVGFERDGKARLVCPAVPGEVLVLPLHDLRETWVERPSPAEKLAKARP